MQETEFDVRVAVAAIMLVATGGALGIALLRGNGFDARIVRTVLAVFVLRVLIACAIFAASVSPVPAIQQHVAAGGIWRQIPDAVGYHEGALDTVDAHARGFDIRGLGVFTYVVGMFYEHVGVNALGPILLNSVADILTLVGVLVLSRRVTGVALAPWMVWTIGLWPSWMVWSTQLLKDSWILALTMSILALLTSLLSRVASWSLFLRYYLLDWIAIIVCVGMLQSLRPALANVITVATVAAALWTILLVVTGRQRRVAALAAIMACVVALQSQAYSRNASGATHVDTSYGYAQLGAAFEREGATNKARRAYRVAALQNPDETFAQARLTALEATQPFVSASDVEQSFPRAVATVVPPPPVSASAPAPALSSPSNSLPNAVARLWHLPSRIVGNFTRLTDVVDPGRVADLRGANLLGATVFGEAADASTFAGLFRLLPVGLAHALVGPFPTTIFDSRTGTTGTLRYFSLVELPWIYGCVVLGFIGGWLSIRSRDAGIVLVVTFIGLGIVALALTVPNDGLLFRYRLPFLVPMAMFAPRGLDVLAAVLRRAYSSRSPSVPEQRQPSA